MVRFHSWFPISGSLREGDWKMIRLPDRLPMLFNVKEDVSELNDIAAGHPELIRKMLNQHNRDDDWKQPE